MVVIKMTASFPDVSGRNLSNLRFPGYRGRWAEIDRISVRGSVYVLLEDMTWGDEVPCLIVDVTNKKVVIDDSYNGFGDLFEKFEGIQ